MTTSTAGPLRPGEVTRAVKQLYPSAVVTTAAAGPVPGARFVTRMPAWCARYLGVTRDPVVAAARLSWHLRAAVTIISMERQGEVAWVGIALAGGPLPPDPGGSRGIPRYATADQVLGDFPATGPVRRMIATAIDGGLRPHLDPCRSPHGRRYRVLLWGTGPDALGGCLDIYEETGRFAEAWLGWGRGPETRYRQDQVAAVRAQLTSARALHQAAP